MPAKIKPKQAIKFAEALLRGQPCGPQIALTPLFSIFVIPFGLASTTLFILQPTMYNSWCTLCLISVAISLSMVPYAWGELVATWRWLRGRRDAGAKLLDALMGR